MLTDIKYLIVFENKIVPVVGHKQILLWDIKSSRAIVDNNIQTWYQQMRADIERNTELIKCSFFQN